MWTSHLSLSVLVLSVSAQNLPIEGVFKAGVGDTPQAVQVSEAAGRHPNATNSVTFARTYDNAPETWTWRVNISEIATPNRISDLGEPAANYSEGLHVVNTQWQIEWPGSGNASLASFLQQRSANLVFTSLISNKPTNITNRYNKADNGNCTAILGSQCAQSLMAAASKRSPVSFVGLEGCEDTLDVQGNGIDSGTGIVIDSSKSNSNSSTASTLQSSDTFFYRTSTTTAAGNLTQLHLSEGALQVLVLNFLYESGSRGDTSGPSVLCQIVDNKAITGSDQNPPSAAATWHGSVGGVWTAVVLSAMFIMFY